jgi:hypothetical protein
MGSDILPIRNDGSIIFAEWANVIRRALMVDVLPRNSSGIVTDQSGSLGDATRRWLLAHLKGAKFYGGTADAFAIELKAPAALAGDYTLTMPGSLPASKYLMKVSAAGIITFEQLATVDFPDGVVTNAKRANTNIVKSAGSGNFSTNSTSYVDITNFSLSITTTTGRIIRLSTEPDNAGDETKGFFNSGTSNGYTRLYRDSTIIAHFLVLNNYLSMSNVIHFNDAPGEGSFTYKLQAKIGGAGLFVAGYMKLVAVEE